MASIISVDNIRATSTSTNAITIDSSNNLGDITMNAEGGTGTLSVRQGVAKAWINFDGVGTIATRDSLNISSIDDDGTGLYGTNFSSSMNNDDFSASTGGGNDTTATSYRLHMPTLYNYTTSTVDLVVSKTSDNSYADIEAANIQVFGDLA